MATVRAAALAAVAGSHTPTQATKENMPLTPSRTQPQYVTSHLPAITPPRLFPVRKLAFTTQMLRIHPSQPISPILTIPRFHQISSPMSSNPFMVTKGRSLAQRCRPVLQCSSSQKSFRKRYTSQTPSSPSSPFMPTQIRHFPPHSHSPATVRVPKPNAAPETLMQNATNLPQAPLTGSELLMSTLHFCMPNPSSSDSNWAM